MCVAFGGEVMVKCVSILGSTGSIGRQTLDIIDHLGIPVAALTSGSSVERMAQQCRKYRPKLAVMATEEAAAALKEAIPDLSATVLWGLLSNTWFGAAIPPIDVSACSNVVLKNVALLLNSIFVPLVSLTS